MKDGGQAFPSTGKGPAYPLVIDDPVDGIREYAGITVLDYFAGQVAGAVYQIERVPCGMAPSKRLLSAKEVAESAYQIAGAMVAERERRMNDGKEAR